MHTEWISGPALGVCAMKPRLDQVFQLSFQTLLPFYQLVGSREPALGGSSAEWAWRQQPSPRATRRLRAGTAGRCCTCLLCARPEPAARKKAARFVQGNPGAQLHFLSGLLLQGPGPRSVALGFAFVSLLCLSNFSASVCFIVLRKATWKANLKTQLPFPPPPSPAVLIS